MINKESPLTLTPETPISPLLTPKLSPNQLNSYPIHKTEKNVTEPKVKIIRDLNKARNCCLGFLNTTSKLAKQQLIKTHLTKNDPHNKSVITNILYNEPRLEVAIFKDYLIYDDFSDYLKRFYPISE
jgi:hypothetical protein